MRRRALDGLDLDVEEPMSLDGVVRLIDALRRDFGPGFIITMAPVASALLDRHANLSGFDYEELERLRGSDINWYHAQFYCGWGDCSNPLMYELILARGWPAHKVVMGVLTNSENGNGWVPWDILADTVPALADRNPGFGGVAGWEYFNALPGGREKPWEWTMFMTALLGDQDASAAAEAAAAAEREPAKPVPAASRLGKPPALPPSKPWTSMPTPLPVRRPRCPRRLSTSRMARGGINVCKFMTG